ncbi:TPA: hypothetical protein ACX6QG_003744 [Photobacterium damselae]
MNNEKIQALFNTVAILSDDLRKATDAANKIQHLNGDKATIEKLVSDFTIIANNSSKAVSSSDNAVLKISDKANKSIGTVEKRANQAIADTQKRSLFLRWTAMIAIIASCILASCAIGFTAGIYMSHQPIVKDIDTRLQIKNKFGVTIKDRAIIIPKDVKIERIGNEVFIPIQ